VLCALHFDVSGEIGMERPSLREEDKREYSSAKEAGRLLYRKASLGFEEATSRSRVF
jgi:hypothetical protein